MNFLFPPYALDKLCYFFQLGLMVNPPKPGDISYLKFSMERYEELIISSSNHNDSFLMIDCEVFIFTYVTVINMHCYHCSKAVLESLRRRAQIMTDGFNSCRNVVCNFTEGTLTYRLFFDVFQLQLLSIHYNFHYNQLLTKKKKKLFQELCTHSRKFAYHQGLLKLLKRPERFPMFSIA